MALSSDRLCVFVVAAASSMATELQYCRVESNTESPNGPASESVSRVSTAVQPFSPISQYSGVSDGLSVLVVAVVGGSYVPTLAARTPPKLRARKMKSSPPA